MQALFLLKEETMAQEIRKPETTGNVAPRYREQPGDEMALSATGFGGRFDWSGDGV